MIEEQLPLSQLNAKRNALFFRSGSYTRGFTKLDVLKRVPFRTGVEPKPVRLIAQRRKDWVLADSPKPVIGIPRIGLLTMHDAMPEVPLNGGNLLGNRV